MAVDLLDHTPQEPLNFLQYRYGLWAWSRTITLWRLSILIYVFPSAFVSISTLHWMRGLPIFPGGAPFWLGCALLIVFAIVLGIAIGGAARQQILNHNAQNFKTIEEFLTSNRESHRQFASLIAKYYV